MGSQRVLFRTETPSLSVVSSRTCLNSVAHYSEWVLLTTPKQMVKRKSWTILLSNTFVLLFITNPASGSNIFLGLGIIITHLFIQDRVCLRLKWCMVSHRHSYVYWGTSSNDGCDSVLSTREEILSLLRNNLTKAQTRMKKYADLKRRELNFPIGSWVYVKLQPYRQTSLSGGKYHKLAKRFYEPYQILEKIGPVAYKVELPSQSKIYNVFHCSRLKLHEGPPQRTLINSPQTLLTTIPSLLLWQFWILKLWWWMGLLCVLHWSSGTGCLPMIHLGRTGASSSPYMTLRTRSLPKGMVLLHVTQ